MREVEGIFEFQVSSTLTNVPELNGAIQMKTYLKIFLALVVIAGSIFWAVNSVRARSYAGTDLRVDVGGGAVTVTNPSEASVPLQLTSPGTRSFSVTSTVSASPASSTTQGEGRDRTQLFEFAVPSGVSEFTVTRGTNVSLIANSDADLQITVQPLPENEARNTLIAVAVVVLGALFFISSLTGHRWISPLRRREDAKQALKLSAEKAALMHGQGQTIRPYGDNRA
jgi:hypothetical protein